MPRVLDTNEQWHIVFYQECTGAKDAQRLRGEDEDAARTLDALRMHGTTLISI